MKCKNCGNEIMPGENFCSACGTSVSEPEEAKQNKKHINKKKKTIIVFAAITFFFILIVLGGIGSSPTSEQTDTPVEKTTNTSTTEKVTETTNTVDSYKSEIKQAVREKDFEKLNNLADEIPKDVQAYFCKETNKLGMEILSSSRAAIIQNDVDAMKKYYDKFAFVDKKFYNKEAVLWDAYSYLGVIAEYSEDYNTYLDARNSTSKIGYYNYTVESRVQSADDSTQYTDEYLIDFFVIGEQGILRTEKNVQRGETVGYLKEIGEGEYTDSSGFEYTYTIYEEPTEEEIDAYLLAGQACDNYYENISPIISNQFYRLLEIINAYAKKNPINITEKNFIGKYVEINDFTPAEYKNTIEFKENGIFVIRLNLGEWIEELKGTYEYKDYLDRIDIELQENPLDVYRICFTVEKDQLIYHGDDLCYLSDGIAFIK